MRKSKLLINIIGAIVFFTLIGCFFLNKKKLMLDAIQNENYEGTILEKFNDRLSHYAPTFKFKNRDKIETMPISIQSLFDKADSGDYIIKKKGTLDYQLIKPNKDTLKFTYSK